VSFTVRDRDLQRLDDEQRELLHPLKRTGRYTLPPHGTTES
jgi:hypothetical protein